METLKEFLTGIDIHVNAKSVTIAYGTNQITIRITEDNKIKLGTNLTIGGHGTKYIDQIDDSEKKLPAT